MEQRDPASAGSPATSVLRVLTWNVHGLRSGVEAVAAVLRSSRCDVAVLQESPRGLRVVPRAADLARRAGLVVAAAGRAGAGTAVLAGVAVAPSRAVVRSLPVRGWRTPRRGLAAVRLLLPGGGAAVVGAVHLGLSEQERAAHVARVHEVVTGLAPAGEPVVVGADLNERPGGPSWAALLPGATDAWTREPSGPGGRAGRDDGATFPARAPRARIDALLVRGAHVGRCEVLEAEDASDHRPVLAELLLPR